MKKALLWVLLIFVFPLYSQEIRKFSNTREAYFQEISSMLLSTNSKVYQEKSEVLLESFSVKWFSERFSKEEKDEIIYTSDMMLEKGMRAYPAFFDFIATIDKVSHTTLPKESVLAWLRSLEPLIKQKSSKNFNNFLDYSVKLFTEDVMFSTRSIAWKFRKGRYVFVYDSVPKLIFSKLDLICSTRKDSSTIENTKGVYLINENHWEGTGGRITWNRVDLDPDKVYADIHSAYKANFRETLFDIDSVSFNNKYYFQQSMLGSLSERVLSSPPNNRTSYPRFESFIKNYDLDNIFPKINFEGGISMEGARLFGSGSGRNLAVLEFVRKDSVFALVKSPAFQIEEGKIVSNRAAVSLYFKGDSIYHPGLNMKYTNEDKMLTLYRSGRGQANSPFYDSYHQIDLYCEAMYWNTGNGKVTFEMIKGLSSESRASFESSNFYSDHDYYHLQGIDPINPLELVKNYSRKYKTEEIFVNAFAEYLDKPSEQVKAMLHNLANRGFLVFNVEDDKVRIKRRLFDYLDARGGVKDYDVISFESNTSLQSNAELNIENFDLKINGVPEIFLSDSQKVYIYPYEHEIIMKKNRSFLFSGLVKAGLFDFYATECSFEYDTFRLNLPVIDSLSFMVKGDTVDENGNPLFVRVRNVLSDLSGDILIDHPGNKSGLKSFPDYPIFNSKEDSYVFYDYNSIRDGSYDRERFFYHVEPFVINKLDNFSTDDLKFTGYLASGNILPNIEEPLVVLPDYSLGFVNYTPEKGYPVYKEKGTFFNKVMLSHNGLLGEGTLKYLSSKTTSTEYVFYLDSLRAIAATFEVEPRDRGVEFPEVTSEVVHQYWITDTNLMTLSMIDNPFSMYANNSKLRGEIDLSPEGMKGQGVFDFSNAEIVSDRFEFYHHSLAADTSDFRLLTASSGELAISTEDYKTYIDFEKRIGNFTTLGQNSIVEFPFNKYISSMDEMVWLMDENKIEMLNRMSERIPYIDKLNLFDLIDFDFSGSEFISTREDQDSLAFFSQKAVYDMLNYTISAEGVKIIKVADAAVFPGDGKVNILRDAQIETLNDAYIVADTSNKYHTFYNSTVNIYSRHKFLAKGSYDYLDANDVPQEIDMSLIAVDSLGKTFASGKVPMSSMFFLSPYYFFTGDVYVKSWRKDLRFSGGFRINQECYTYNEDWVEFDTIINPYNITLPVDEKVYDLDHRDLQVAICQSATDYTIYPAFFTSKDNPEDRVLVSANGRLKYDPDRKQFRVGSPGRIRNTSLVGNSMILATKQCVLSGSGKLDLGVSLETMELQTFGEIEHLIIPDSTKLNSAMVMDFYFNEKLMEAMADSINRSNLPGINISRETYQLALINILGEADASEVISELNLYGNMKRFPDELYRALVFSDVELFWNQRTSSYISTGKIGLANILKHQVNKYVDGYIEIEKRRSGDAINIYLELSDRQWYFFSYRGNVMQAISSDQQFNDILSDINPGERIITFPGHDNPYEYVISTRRKQVDFVRKMEDVFN